MAHEQNLTMINPVNEKDNTDRHKCRQCQYRSKDCVHGKTGCDFYIITDAERGCDVECCTRPIPGPRLKTQKELKAVKIRKIRIQLKDR